MKDFKMAQIAKSLYKMDALRITTDAINSFKNGSVFCSVCKDNEYLHLPLTPAMSKAVKSIESKGFNVYYCLLKGDELTCLYTSNEEDLWEDEIMEIEETLKGKDIKMSARVVNLNGKEDEYKTVLVRYNATLKGLMKIF